MRKTRLEPTHFPGCVRVELRGLPQRQTIIQQIPSVAMRHGQVVGRDSVSTPCRSPQKADGLGFRNIVAQHAYGRREASTGQLSDDRQSVTIRSALENVECAGVKFPTGVNVDVHSSRSLGHGGVRRKSFCLTHGESGASDRFQLKLPAILLCWGVRVMFHQQCGSLTSWIAKSLPSPADARRGPGRHWGVFAHPLPFTRAKSVLGTHVVVTFVTFREFSNRVGSPCGGPIRPRNPATHAPPHLSLFARIRP